MTTNAEWAAYIRGLSVPTGMPGCRRFVDVMAGAAEGGVFDVNAVAKAQAAALLEIIDRLGRVDDGQAE